VREGVSHQEIAEFVVNARHWDRQARKKREANGDNKQKEQNAAKQALARKRKNAAPRDTRETIAPSRENDLKSKNYACANQELMKSANQRLQIRRVRAGD
jgi:hypothetical protein